MWLTLVGAHKPHCGVTLVQVHTRRREDQMLKLSHSCGKCQRCRWQFFFSFLFFVIIILRECGCDLSLYDMGHLIHKHAAVVEVVVRLADSLERCQATVQTLYYSSQAFF